MRIAGDSGNVGIGTTSPNQPLHVVGNARFTASLLWAGSGATNSYLDGNTTSLLKLGINDRDRIKLNATEITFNDATSEFARIDSSGRLLVGTSTFAQTNTYSNAQKINVAGSAGAGIQLQGYSADQFNLAIDFSKSRGASVGTNTIVQNADSLGNLIFNGYDGSAYKQAVKIEAFVDGTPGANDMPGRLVFSVTADGSASPTEALRISNNRAITVSDGGNVVLGTTTGTKIGTATSQKIGFYNATPVVQPTTGVAEAAFVENSGGTAVNVDSTFGGYTIQQVVQALQTLGLLA
jgi:hypothetical protein